MLRDGLNQMVVRIFAQQHLAGGVDAHSDALPALASLAKTHTYDVRVTPSEQAMTWLPKVHLIISNLKRFLLGIFHGVSHRYLSEYIDEFIYRFNRRHWESQLPQRLLEAAATHTPILSHAA
jgi:hypothetical protein